MNNEPRTPHRAPRTAHLEIVMTLALLLWSMAAGAQNADIQRVAAHYKKTTETTAQATRTHHVAAVTKDETTTGELRIRVPDLVSISTNGGKEQLIMEGTRFTMTTGGVSRTTDSTRNPLFATFRQVLQTLIGGPATDLETLQGVTVASNGRELTITITPQAETNKARRRMVFTAITLTVDVRTGVFRRLRLDDRSGYTEYVFG